MDECKVPIKPEWQDCVKRHDGSLVSVFTQDEMREIMNAQRKA